MFRFFYFLNSTKFEQKFCIIQFDMRLGLGGEIRMLQFLEAAGIGLSYAAKSLHSHFAFAVFVVMATERLLAQILDIGAQF